MRQRATSPCAARARTLLLSVLLTAGCSALGYDDFAVFDCGEASDEACEPLNQRDGVAPDACARWQCAEQTGQCEYRERRDDDDDGEPPVACGGGDCDDSDPQAFPGADPNPIEVGTISGPGWVRWVAGPETWVALFGGQSTPPTMRGLAPEVSAEVTGARGLHASAADPTIEIMRCDVTAGATYPLPTSSIPDCGASSTECCTNGTCCATHEECQDGLFCNGFETCEPTSPASGARGCRSADRMPCATPGDLCLEELRMCRSDYSAPGPCKLRQTAAAPVTVASWLAASIDVEGCQEGLLRFGWLGPGAPDPSAGEPGPNLLMRGGLERAPGFVGVDPNEDRCTGDSRPDAAPAGASGVAIAGLPAAPSEGRRRPQALAAWQGAPRERELGLSPADAAAPVEVLGLWLEEQGGVDGTLRWASATDAGQPQRLEPPMRGSAPVALAATSAGPGAYVLGYAAEEGGVALFRFEGLAEPPGVRENPPYVTELDGGGVRMTPPLGAPAASVVLQGAGGAGVRVEAVHLAVGPADGAAAPLGVAWVEAGQACFRAARTDALGEAGEAACAGAGVSAVAVAALSGGAAAWALAHDGEAGLQLAWLDASGAVIEREALSAAAGGATGLGLRSTGDAVRVGWAEDGRVLSSRARCTPR